MNWTEVEDKYKAKKVPPPTASAGWKDWRNLRVQIDALLTHFARAAVGLPVDELDVGNARNACAWAYAEAFMAFGYGAGGSTQDSDHGKAVCALLAAALGDPDTVAKCTKGKALGSKVQPNKTFHKYRGLDIAGLARHLATAARARLPASHVTAALAPVRDDFAADRLKDPRVALVAAHIFASQIALADVPSTTKAWLAGESLDLPERSAKQAVADGDDPRVKIFEQFAPRFGVTDEAFENQRQRLRKPADPKDDRFAHAAFWGSLHNQAAIWLTMAGHKLPDAWNTKVDPYVVLWLGAKVTPKQLAARRARQVAENKDYGKPDQVRRYVRSGLALEPALRALHLGDLATLAAYTGGGKLAAFAPGKFFKDDWRKLFRYLGSAIEAGAARADVEPAWFDFLSRPLPSGIWMVALLAIQHVIAVELGDAKPATVGRELQLLITGV